LIFILSCSGKYIDVPSANADYFIGTWRIAKDAEPMITSSLLTNISLQKSGKLNLNIVIPAGTDPMYRWSYNGDDKEFSIFLPGEETYVLREVSDKYFKVKNKNTNDLLIFTRI